MLKYIISNIGNESRRSVLANKIKALILFFKKIGSILIKLILILLLKIENREFFYLKKYFNIFLFIYFNNMK